MQLLHCEYKITGKGWMDGWVLYFYEHCTKRNSGQDCEQSVLAAAVRMCIICIVRRLLLLCLGLAWGFGSVYMVSID